MQISGYLGEERHEKPKECHESLKVTHHQVYKSQADNSTWIKPPASSRHGNEEGSALLQLAAAGAGRSNRDNYQRGREPRTPSEAVPERPELRGKCGDRQVIS